MSDDSSLSGNEDAALSPVVKKRKPVASSGASRSKKLKKGRSGGGGLFEDEVEEASDEEESENEREVGYTNVEVSRHEKEVNRRYEERRRQQEAFEAATEEDLGRRLAERYRDSSGADYTNVDHSGMDLSRNANLPTVTDPKLYAVRCKPGEEKLLVVRLMSKYLDSRKNRDPKARMQILSAVSPGTKGYIYVEAFSEIPVKSAIYGLRDVYQKLTLIPLKQMVSVMNVTVPTGSSKISTLRPNQFVRLKMFPYKGDLAKVEKVLYNGTKALVKMVPRIDFEMIKLRRNFDADDASIKNRRAMKIVPQKILLKAEDLANVGIEVEKLVLPSTDELVDYVPPPLDAYFKDGFLLKEISTRSINAKNVDPSIEELNDFNALDDDNAVSALMQTTDAPEATAFSVGDMVVVVKGQLEQITGKVVEVKSGFKSSTEREGQFQEIGQTSSSREKSETIVRVKPFHEEIKNEILEFNPSQLKKLFRVGDHVKMLTGENMGETGTVVEVISGSGQWKAVVFSDVSKKEMTLDVNNLQRTNETSSGRDSLLNYRMYDFVKLAAGNVGVVVNVGSDSLTILDLNSRISSLPVSAIQSKINVRKMTSVTSFDKGGNSLGINDRVKILIGKNTGLEGSVRFLHKTRAFVFSKQLLDNAGMMVVFSKSCSLIGGGNTSKPQFTPKSGRTGDRGGFSGSRGRGRGRGGSAMGRGSFNRDDSLKGTTVRIAAGKYKGYVGIVTDIRNNTAKVELHTKNKAVSIDKSKIRPVDQSGNGGRSSMGSRRSSYNPSSPYVSNYDKRPEPIASSPSMKTPAFAPETPKHSYEPPKYNDVPEPMDYSSVKTPAPAYGDFSVKTPGPGFGMNVQTPGITMQSVKTPGLTQIPMNVKTPGLTMQNVRTPGITVQGYMPPRTPAFASGTMASYGSSSSFQISDSVMILSGDYRGQSGVVQGSERNEIFVMLDGTGDLAIVKESDIKKSN